MCSQKTYCFYQGEKRLCKQCFSGFCPKAVTDVMPLECLFCDSVQTWYLYAELNRMRCTNCEGHRAIECLAAEECPKCEIYQPSGLLTYGDMSWCEHCFGI